MALNSCSTVGENLGAPDCQGRRQVPGLIVVGGKEFTAAEYADSDTFQDALLAATKLSSGDSDKLYAFPVINKVTNNTEQDSTGSLALGPVVRLRKGRPSYSYVMQDLSQAQYKKLLSFDNQIVPVFTFDDASQFWGKRDGTTSNTTNTNTFKGERARVSISGNGFKDAENVETGQCVVTVSYISIDDFEKRSAFIKLPDLSSGDLVGLMDVMLSEPSAHVSNVHKIKMTVPVPEVNGDINIYDTFGAAIAALTWNAYTGTGYTTSLTITTIAVDAVNECLTVTFDSTAYTALGAGANIKLVPPSVSVLEAADVTGIEIGYIILTT